MTPFRKHLASDVMEELEALAEAHIEKAAGSTPPLSREQAMVEAIGSRPDLYVRYEEERRSGRYAPQAEAWRPVPTARGVARQQLEDLAQTRAARITKRAGESDEARLARFLDSDEGRTLYAAYERV
jgi:hypothetical protein